MNESLNFIGIKKLRLELFLNTLKDTLARDRNLNENLYLSILPPVEEISFVEIADFLPLTRYKDISIEKFLLPVTRSFNVVYYLDRNVQTNTSKYQKYMKSTLEREYKGAGALEKGIKFDLIMNLSDIESHMKRARTLSYSENEEKPRVFQIVKDKELLDPPLELDYKTFYTE
jgi:hypothetical protein